MKWDEFTRQAKGLGVEVTEEAVAALAEYEERLYKANETKNLTGVPREDCRARHFLDSLSLLPFIPHGSSVIDIGTGAGLPGVVLSIVRPDLRLTLLDSATKEIRFLETLSDIATFGLIMERAEIAGRDPNFRESYDVATGRAVTRAATQAEISSAFVKVGGLYIPQRAANEIATEYDVLGLKLKRQAMAVVAGVNRLMPIYEKVGPLQDRFPRTWAAMKRREAR